MTNEEILRFADELEDSAVYIRRLVAENEALLKEQADLKHVAYHLGEDKRELLSENEALRADAERYRWLREHPAWETESFLSSLTPEQFDVAIDAARSKT